MTRAAADAGRGRTTRALPSGTVTFLFTDIEGSTRLLERLGTAYEMLLDEHHRRIRAAIEAGGGVEVNTEGDSFFAAFANPSGALLAAADAQRRLAGGGWSPDLGDVTVAVRMGIHTGEATSTGDDYVGIEVHRAARIGAAAHGGQILVSSATRALAEDRLPPGTRLRDLGEHRLRDLSRPERISQLVVDGLREDFPRPRTLDTTPNNLPLQLTSFVGRASLVAEARRLLASTRLLTLSGPGGTGKTRLSLQVAAELVDAFPDGVYFVPLASVFSPDLVPSAILAALGETDGNAAPLDRLTAHLRSRRTLLVLDNFEQVLPAAPMISGLLRMTESLKLLVTSRSVLRVSGEYELPVPPLGLPDPHHLPPLASMSQYEAVQLFVERAVAARPDFAVTNENAPAVAEITARLDGLPLAIELAAARLRVLSPQAILARLGDRLGLLSGGARDLPERQQTLRAAIAWSYDLLEPDERQLFERLGAFAGGWTLEAAEAVCGAGSGAMVDVFDGLTSLAEKSLVRAQDDAHGDARFLMLETIRAFAVERLDAGPDGEEIRGRHAAYFLAVAERVGTALFDEERRARLTALEDDHDNFRGARAWYEGRGDLPALARLLAALWRFWQMHGHLYEARGAFDRAIALDDARHGLSPTERRALLTAAGGIAYWQGDMQAANGWYREAVDLARANEDPIALANALYDLSFAPVPTTNTEWLSAIGSASKPYLDEALEIFRAAGDRAGVARILWGLVQYYTFGNRLAEADQASAEALALHREVGNAFGVAWALHSVGLVKAALGQVEPARTALHEALDLFEAAGDVSGMVLLAADFASLALAAERREATYRITAAAATLIERTGTNLGKVSYQGPGLPPLPTGPDTDEERTWWSEGSQMTMADLLAYIRSSM